MMVRHALLPALCGICVIVVAGLSAQAAMPADDATRIDLNRGTVNLDRTPATNAPDRAQIGNPLWAIPLGSLANTRNRPLFTPSRRPPPLAVVAAPPVVQPKPIVRSATPDRPNLMLIGTVVGKAESIGVFVDRATQDIFRLKTGEEHLGWVLRSIGVREATLEKGSQSETLRLPVPASSERAADR
jgi:general secretion pathway protein N